MVVLLNWTPSFTDYTYFAQNNLMSDCTLFETSIKHKHKGNLLIKNENYVPPTVTPVYTVFLNELIAQITVLYLILIINRPDFCKRCALFKENKHFVIWNLIFLNKCFICLIFRDQESNQVPLQSVGGINRVKTVKIIKMLAVVVINFCICWLPLFTIFNIIKFSPNYLAFEYNTTTSGGEEGQDDDEFTRVILFLVPFAQLLGSANSCVNPWIYCFYSKRYRRGFKRVFLCRSMRKAATRRTPRPQSLTANFHRNHNLAIRTVEQTTYTWLT